MKVLLFGASGMVGQGVLRECLLDPAVTEVLAIGRSATGRVHAKLREIRHVDLLDLAAVESGLAACDACFFCLGVSAAGMSEQAYTRLTHDLTLSVARTLARLHPGMTFTYVSGAGSDRGGHGRSMWARVKGRTENELLELALRATMFRPAIIVPMHGERSKTLAYRLFYSLARPLLPLLRRALPRYVTTTEHVGRAMIAVAVHGSPKPVLENDDINAF
jgi:uncharacterized protein YbjT (DUF2867 family)